jgi:DNA-binding transcriptional LysR family regulator
MARCVRYKDLQLAPLRSFCAVATRGGFSQAAEVLGLATATIWQQVRALERLLGTSLLERRGREVVLTDEGVLLLELSQPHVNGLDSLVRLWETRRDGPAQRLTVACPPYLLSHHLPGLVQQFITDHPAVLLNLRVAAAPEVMQLVERGRADLGMTYYDPGDPLNRSLEYEDVFELFYTLLTSVRHPLTRKKRVSLGDVVEYPMILPPRGEFNDRTLQMLLQRHGLADRVHAVLETRNIDIVARYVAADVGVTLAYLSLDSGTQMPGVKLRLFDPSLPGLPVRLIARKGAHLPWHGQAFWRLVRQSLAARRDAGRD